MEEQRQSNLIPLCGLWKNESKGGIAYLGGTLGMCKVLVFRTSEKRGENSPDYMLYIAPKPPKQEGAEADDKNGTPF